MPHNKKRIVVYIPEAGDLPQVRRFTKYTQRMRAVTGYGMDVVSVPPNSDRVGESIMRRLSSEIGFVVDGGGVAVNPADSYRVLLHEVAHIDIRRRFGSLVLSGSRWENTAVDEAAADYQVWLWSRREFSTSLREILRIVHQRPPAESPFADRRGVIALFGLVCLLGALRGRGYRTRSETALRAIYSQNAPPLLGNQEIDPIEALVQTGVGAALKIVDAGSRRGVRPLLRRYSALCEKLVGSIPAPPAQEA